MVVVKIKLKITLAQEPNLLSIPKFRRKIRSVVWKNATIKTLFGLHKWWLTFPPPGGGGPKLRKSIGNKIKKARFHLPSPQFAKISDISNVGILLIASWHKYKDTSPPIGHVIGKIRLSRDRATGHYCPVLDKNWVNDWNVQF